MTLIVAYVSENKSFIASDRMGSDEHSGAVYKTKKVFQKGKMLFGGAGSYRQLQLVQNSFELPLHRKNENTDSYIFTKFMPALTDFFQENSILKESKGLQESQAEFIFVYDGRIFRMQDDLSLLEPDIHFETLGEGSEYAHAVLTTLDELLTDLTAKDKLRMAVELTSHYILAVGGGVEIISL